MSEDEPNCLRFTEKRRIIINRINIKIRIYSWPTNTSSLQVSFEASNARLTESRLRIGSWWIVWRWISWRNVIRTMSRGRCCCCWLCCRRRSWLSYTSETACKRWNEKSFQNITDPAVLRSVESFATPSENLRNWKNSLKCNLTSGENCSLKSFPVSQSLSGNKIILMKKSLKFFSLLHSPFVLWHS